MNWYKVAKLEDVWLIGELMQGDDGYVYIKVDDDIVHGLFDQLDKKKGIEKAPYFGRGEIGAHISCISDNEVDEDLEIKEIGEDIPFKLLDIKSTNPDGWDEMERVWFVQVDCPRIKDIRKSYGLPASYLGKGHKFHITFAVKEK